MKSTQLICFTLVSKMQKPCSSILSCVVGLWIGFSGCTQEKQQTENSSISDSSNLPNIVYILADDMGFGDISALNAESGIPTPNMDRVVNEGIYFTDAHSGSGVCTPTRYGILTGRYAWRSRLKSGVLWGYDPPLIENERTTVASFLQDNGYHTGVVGKWHLGLGWQKKDPEKAIGAFDWNKLYEKGGDSNVDFSKPVIGGPKEVGFNYSYIVPASLDMTPYLYLENDLAVEPPTDFTEGKNQKTDGRGVFWRAGEVSPSFDFYQVLPTLAEKAVGYIESCANSTDPFFLYFPLTAPHTPWLPSDQVDGKSQAGTYGDFVVQVDQVVGAVLDALDSLDLTDNTLIIVTSDNGSDWNEQDKASYSHRANYIYRGRKADIYEGGHRIPYMARWPGRITPGSKSEQVLCTTDLMATLAGVIEKPLPSQAGEDSYNMLTAYTGQVATPIRDYTIHHSLNGYFAIRKGKWKYTPHLGSGGFTQPADHDPKEEGFEGTLYDLEADPGEITNLYNKHPEIVTELGALLEQAKRKE